MSERERIFAYVAEGTGAPEAGETREEFEARMAKKPLQSGSPSVGQESKVPSVIDRSTGLPTSQKRK